MSLLMSFRYTHWSCSAILRKASIFSWQSIREKRPRQLDIIWRVRELETLSPNGTSLSNLSQQGSRHSVEEETERSYDPRRIQVTKETVASIHNRTDTHMNSKRCGSDHRAFKVQTRWVDLSTERVKWTWYNLPSLREKIVPIDHWLLLNTVTTHVMANYVLARIFSPGYISN